MQEVSGPIVAIALVLCAVFVPMAFLSGVTGQFYKHFAVTIAISTVISAINSLTLSPALAAKLLKSHGTPKDGLSRLIERLFGWVFRPFNRFFKASSDRYQGTVSRTLKHRGSVFAVYALLLVVTGMLFQAVPRGFIPTQDKLYLMAGVKLPEGASLDRTDAVLRQVVAISKTVDGIAHVVAMTGLNPLQFTNTPNYGIAFLILKPFDERHRSAKEISEEMNQKISAIKEGITFVLMPPPILGLGNGAGYALFVEDRAGLGFGALQNAVSGLQGAVMQTPGMGFPISGYQANVPQLDAEVDRVKTKTQGIALTELFNTLQVYLGSAYVNDFNLFGRATGPDIAVQRFCNRFAEEAKTAFGINVPDVRTVREFPAVADGDGFLRPLPGQCEFQCLENAARHAFADRRSQLIGRQTGPRFEQRQSHFVREGSAVLAAEPLGRGLRLLFPKRPLRQCPTQGEPRNAHEAEGIRIRFPVQQD
jgi:multidrug efflux pump